jgi:hypothetical protein
MRKLRFIGLLVLAVCAYGVFTASAAFAESKILFNEAEIVALLPFTIEGSLLLEDMKALAGENQPDILCTGFLDGMVEPKGTLGYIEEALTAAKELLAGEAGDLIEDCSDDKSLCSNPVDVEAINLPWHFEIQLDLSETLEIYLAHFLSLAEIEELLETGVGVPAFTIDCNSLLGLVLDTCEGLTSARLFNSAEGLLASFNTLLDSEKDGAESEEGNCTLGGVKQGLVVSVTLGNEEDTEASAGLVLDTEVAGTFSVSP